MVDETTDLILDLMLGARLNYEHSQNLDEVVLMGRTRLALRSMDIYRLKKDGYSNREIAEIYNVTRERIYQIYRRLDKEINHYCYLGRKYPRGKLATAARHMYKSLFGVHTS